VIFRSPCSPKKRMLAKNAGFTIVELMVALALLISAAVGAIYLSSKQSFRVQDNSSGMDEIMRAIEEDMSREIRKAGYFGCFRWKEGLAGSTFALTARLPQSQSGKYPIPMDGTAVKLGAIYDVRGGGSTTTTITPLQSTVAISPGSEYLSISYGQPQAYLSAAMTSGVEKLALNRKISVKNGQPLLLANCDAMTLMRADQDGPRDDIAHDPATGDNISLGDPVWAYTLFAQGSTLMSLQSSVFFLGQKAGDPPTLYLLSPDDTTTPAQPLAANVEQLNFLYGVDTGGTSLTFNTATAVTAANQWASVRAVRVGLVLRSSDDNVSAGTAANAGVNFSWNAAAGRYDSNNTATDRRLRKAHVFTVAIRGRSPSI
jgi:type IV pilus assembly protein PilW